MEVVIATILIVGDAVAHGHQMFLIIKDGNTIGLSTSSIVLNFISSLTVTVNLIMLDGYRFLYTDWFSGLSYKSTTAWFAAMQLVTSSAYTAILVITYNIFADRKERFRTMMITLIAVGFQIFTISVCVYFDAIQIAGIVLGIAASAITIVTWLPQIWLLLRRRDKGELSLVMILAHLFGSWLAVFFQAVLNDEQWTIWASSAVMGVEQCFLLALWVRASYVGKLA
jgi:uncharacterized protein with PQ loop repeat